MTVTVDRYTKFVLTVIAIALTVIAARPLLESEPATAQSQVVQVDLVRIGGWSLTLAEPINVRIKD